LTAADAVPWRPVPGGVEVAVRVTPRASRAALGGIVADGGPSGFGGSEGAWLVARVTPPPEDGRANAALVALLAEALGVAPSACEVVAGTTSRRKRVRVVGTDVATLERRLAATATAAGSRLCRPER